MSSLYLPKGRPYNKYGVLCFQQQLLEAHCPFLSCSITNKVLVAIGWLQPNDCKVRYKIKIEYVAGHEPKSTILYPIIEPARKIHMYPDHSLCLHYALDMKWTEKIKIYQYTVPWIAEWIIYYEIYLLNGGYWEGPESPLHMKDTDMNINQDIG
jgi:hypothetical protein